MKCGFEILPGVTVSWRADSGDRCVDAHFAMLHESVGMDELPDDGRSSCRLLPDNHIPSPPDEVIAYQRMKIRFDLAGGVNDITLRDFDETPEELEHSRWRNVRRVTFQGLVPHILRRECFIVHGALLENGDGGMLLCGPSGVGKSTTSLRLSKFMNILADDIFCLYRRDGNWYARPLPTWSSYLFGKVRLAKCEARHEAPVKQLLIIGRSAEKYTALPPGEAMLGVANSFTDMIKWHIERYPGELRSELLAAAVDGAAELARTLPAGALQLSLECDVHALLADVFENMKSRTTQDRIG